LKYTEQTINEIIKLSNFGFSSRDIAGLLSISKSGVNNVLSRKSEEMLEAEYKESIKPDGPRILIVDHETSAALVYCFGRNKQFISDSGVHKEGGKILMSGVRWYGAPKETTEVLYDWDEIRRGEDSYVCEALYNMVDEADAFLSHNSLGFDWKVLQTRGLMNGLGILPTTKVLDTLQIARKKLRLPTNKLDTIGQYFGIGEKLKHEGIKLWRDVQEGCPDALERMVAYCRQDVDLLHDVYTQLRPLGHSATLYNAGLYFDDGKMHCNVCGSDHVAKTGNSVYTALSEFSEYECLDCGNKMRDRQAKNSKEQRKNLLTSIVN
jgi:transposase-like protein